jgi:hypothetical protein
MTTLARVLPRIVVVVFLVVGCSRTAAKSGDTAVVAATDSATPASSTPPAVVATPDSTKGGATPAPSSGAPPKATPAPTATPSETVLTGRVTVTGLASDQRTMLRVEGGTPTTLTGPLEPELRRLNAATVWVAGAPGTGAPNASFAVSRYEIVSIDGSKPIVGVLVARDGSTWLAADRDTVKLAATTPEIRAKVGAKVWIVGRRTGSELTPQSFGVIREP